MTRLAALLLLLAWPAAAQPEAQPSSAEPWVAQPGAIRSPGADVSFPRQAGTLSVVQTGEFSRQGEHLDNFIQYRSADNAVIGTVYVYYPGLAHSGLAALATDFAIRANSQRPVRTLGSRTVGAGGQPGVAIRTDYDNYRDRFASSGAFIKLDRWQVKLRVSGPEERRAEVEAAMTALLDGIRFGPAHRPRPAAPIALSRCAPGAGATAANLLPDPPGAEIAAQALLATLDGGGNAGTDEATGARRDLPSRVPDSMCLSSPEGSPRAILRSAEGPALSIDGRTMLVVVVSDSGEFLEVVRAENLGGHILLYHRIGSTAVPGRFDGVPSDAQIEEMFADPGNPAARVRAAIDLRPGGADTIHLPDAQADRQIPVT